MLLQSPAAVGEAAEAVGFTAGVVEAVGFTVGVAGLLEFMGAAVGLLDFTAGAVAGMAEADLLPMVARLTLVMDGVVMH
jgi:hypothetical protein